MGPLRGREAECAELSRLIVSAAGGAGGVVAVEGAAGIGKSRLLAEAARMAAAAGLQVAAAACEELDRVTPWAPLLRALSATSPVLLSNADLAPVRTLADQRLAVIDCIRSALEQASRRQPLLITLDDLQWADPATLLAVASLTRQLFSFPAAWILAQRPLPASSRLQSLATRLADAGASRLHLRPLDDDAARAMAADMTGARTDAGVAAHLALGAQPGDEQAIAVLTQAIAELSPTSATVAADLSLRVLDLTGPDDPRRPGLVARAVGLLGWASRVDQARALGEGYLRDHPQPARVEAEIQHGMRRAWVRTTHAPYPAPLPAGLVTDPAVPHRTRADLIAFDQVGAMWQAPAEQVERALQEAAGLTGDSGGDASLSILRNVRIALAHEHGRLLEAMQTARSDPHPIRHTLPGQGGGQGESAVAFCLCAIGRPGEAFELLAQGQRAAQASGDTFVVVRCQARARAGIAGTRPPR